MDTRALERRIEELEAALAASNNRYQQLLGGLAHLPSGLEIYDRTGLAAYLNPAMVQMTGLPSADVALGRFNILTDPFSIETGLKPLYDRAYAGEVVQTDEFVIAMERASDDWGTSAREVWFKMVLVPLFDLVGDVESVLAIMLETTEDRRTKKALELVSRRDGIELLAGGVAHDFNNLLTAIITNSQLAMEMSSDTDVHQLCGDILRASDQAVFLTRQLLDYAHQKTQHVETVDLRELTRSITRAFRNALLQAGRLDLDLADRPLLVEVEAGKYKQVVMNIMTNAMQALPAQDGIIGVSLHEAVLDAEALAGFKFSVEAAPGPWNVLEIRDNGCGMPPEIRDRIFEPYFTTKTTGSGLGLASTLGIIWSHGGGVSVQSEPGEGTLFRVCLPLSQRSQALPIETHGPMALPEGARVLLADNSPYLRGSLRALLERLGLTVLEASNGEEALELFEAASPRPDLALLDIMTPVQNGVDVLRALRGQGSSLPVLLMSTHEEVGHRSVADDPHATFIAKPFSPAQLVQALSRHLREPA